MDKNSILYNPNEKYVRGGLWLALIISFGVFTMMLSSDKFNPKVLSTEYVNDTLATVTETREFKYDYNVTVNTKYGALNINNKEYYYKYEHNIGTNVIANIEKQSCSNGEAKYVIYGIEDVE